MKRLAVVPAALLTGGVLAFGGMVLVALRGSWSHLPLYIGFWLDLGVVVATALLAVVGRGLADGLAFSVLRAPELGLLLAAGLLLAIATTGLAYTHLRLANEVEGQQRRMAELERTDLTSQLTALSAQINPHFLFNTLNTLAELVHEDEDAAEDLVTDLAHMMRGALRSSTGLVPLDDELDLVRRRLRIEEARLGDRLTWSVASQLPEGIEVSVPGLSVQPLVENAVKYAAATRSEGGTVRVAVRVVDQRVWIVVTGDGPGLPDDVVHALETGVPRGTTTGTEGHGGGLWNCRERVRLLWPDGEARLRQVAQAVGTCLILELPHTERSP